MYLFCVCECAFGNPSRAGLSLSASRSKERPCTLEKTGQPVPPGVFFNVLRRPNRFRPSCSTQAARRGDVSADKSTTFHDTFLLCRENAFHFSLPISYVFLFYPSFLFFFLRSFLESRYLDLRGAVAIYFTFCCVFVFCSLPTGVLPFVWKRSGMLRCSFFACVSDERKARPW